jgi:hypothetical protein
MVLAQMFVDCRTFFCLSFIGGEKKLNPLTPTDWFEILDLAMAKIEKVNIADT